MNADTYRILASLQKLGFTYDQARALRRISMTLNRWFELECGTDNGSGSTHSIERDENGEGKPFYRIQYMSAGGQWVDNRHPIADREAGARRRLAAIMAPFKRRLVAYVQGDCRGASLYILRKADVKGEDISTVYSRGIAVY